MASSIRGAFDRTGPTSIKRNSHYIIVSSPRRHSIQLVLTLICSILKHPLFLEEHPAPFVGGNSCGCTGRPDLRVAVGLGRRRWANSSHDAPSLPYPPCLASNRVFPRRPLLLSPPPPPPRGRGGVAWKAVRRDGGPCRRELSHSQPEATTPWSSFVFAIFPGCDYYGEGTLSFRGPASLGRNYLSVP